MATYFARLSDGRTVSGDTPAHVQVAAYALEATGELPYQVRISIEVDHEPPSLETATEVTYGEVDDGWARTVAAICG